MRHRLPGLANLLVVLLLFQWGAGLGACLPSVDLSTAICHGGTTAPDGPQKAKGGVCPLCSPLPVSLADPPAAVPPPRALLLASAPPAWAMMAATPTRPRSPLPRGPPLPT